MLDKGDYDIKLKLYNNPENDERLRSIKLGTRKERSEYNDPNNVKYN